MEEYKVGIVIPAFNEELTIAQVVNSVKGYGYAIVVNDASTDRTRKIAEDAGVRVVSHQDNKGYDGALNSGFKRAKELDCDGIITFDADGQHDSASIPDFIIKLEEGFDLVLGVRPKTQRFSEKIFKMYTSKKYKWNDPLCGMKGYNMKLYRELGFFDSYKSIGTELSLFGLVKNTNFCEVKINMNVRRDKPRFSSLILSNIIIFRALYLSIKYKKN